jgi:two-component system cell cycle response regulator DivK
VIKLLCVEDNDNNIFLLQVRLGDIAGHQVLIARDGQEAFRMALAEEPDVILMDLELPVVSGWEVVRQLKARSATAAIPVIALSAHALTGSRETALAAGCDEFESKPVDFVGLLAKIERLVSRRNDAE